MLQRVAKHQYLFRRGTRFYFRRAVPKDVAHAFGGKPDVTVSLRTDSIDQARHALAQCLKSFDRTLAQARSLPDPTRSVVVARAIAHEPDRDEIDAAVRAWLKSTEAHTVERVVTSSPSELDGAAGELEHFELAG